MKRNQYSLIILCYLFSITTLWAEEKPDETLETHPVALTFDLTNASTTDAVHIEIRNHKRELVAALPGTTGVWASKHFTVTLPSGSYLASIQAGPRHKPKRYMIQLDQA